MFRNDFIKIVNKNVAKHFFIKLIIKKMFFATFLLKIIKKCCKTFFY
jgi:hypothetical protein